MGLILNTKFLFRRLFSVGVIVLILLGGYGCRKCIDCSYTYQDPQTGEELQYNYAEFCGSNEEVDNFEQQVKSEAAEVDGEVKCQQENALLN